MPGPRPCAVTLAREVREKLQAVCRAATSTQRAVLRARIVLLAADGHGNAEIASRLHVTVSTVRKWRGRFARKGMAGLRDLARTGRPCRFDAVTRSELISLACRPVPEELCRTQWTHEELRQAILGAGLVSRISVSTIGRILDEVDLRPQHFRMWVHSPDPLFRPKVAELCALYTTIPGPHEVVLCIDEKTGMQALRRRFTGRLPGPAECGRWEFEYKRLGTRCLTAAFDVHTGEVFGRVTKRRTKQDLLQFLEALARRYPHQTVHIVWDNLNTHHGAHIEDFNRRHGARFQFHYTPIHASWCNQIELWFSILARRVLRRASFRDAEDLECRVLRFISVWNQHECKPFRWTFRGYPLQTGVDHAQVRFNRTIRRRRARNVAAQA
jgi:transposase